jgi:hypothetical protein
MDFVPFVFVDGWRIFSYNGNYINIRNEDLISYYENGLSEDEIKSISYSYLVSNNFADFSPVEFQTYEF